MTNKNGTSTTSKRKTQTAARFKEYGLSGFFYAFEKVAANPKEDSAAAFA